MAGTTHSRPFQEADPRLIAGSLPRSGYGDLNVEPDPAISRPCLLSRKDCVSRASKVRFLATSLGRWLVQVGQALPVGRCPTISGAASATFTRQLQSSRRLD